MERKPIPKSLRFEVFKRDKFTCQYCGTSAPDVILEVDHLMPVSKGGKNDILNLVTACRDCNRGKTNKELSDDSAVKVQKERLDDLQERREQLKLMIQWRNSLVQETEEELDSIDNLLFTQTKFGMSDIGRKNVRQMVMRFGYNAVFEALQTSINQYYDGTRISVSKILKKLGGICYNRQKERERNAEQDS